jgi:hypothetical protein
MSDLFARAERLMAMDEAAWARHANPWSGWTRFAILPAFALAVWSRVWLGWGALIPVAAVIGWTWLNPRAFAPPADHGAWMTRGVLGERLWLDRARRTIPAHHIRAAHLTTATAALGLPALAWGLWALDLFATLLGLVLAVLGKAWFLDRMVWLHADLTGTVPGTPLPDPTLPPPERPAP